MADAPSTPPSRARTSRWPLLVALGLALSEVGVALGLVAVAVLGLLVFGAAVAGVLDEAGYAATPWRPLRVLGGALAAGGGWLWLSRAGEASLRALLAAPETDGFALRGAAILVAGALLAVAGLVGPSWLEPERG